MVILITGASHTGKTLLARRLVEALHYPSLSIDHLKMGLIRSGYTELTPEDDLELTDYLWPVVREMMKTVVENRQDLILEGCYVPFAWRRDFDERYLPDLRFLCLAMTEAYIDAHFDDILAHRLDVEARLEDPPSPAELKKDNRACIEGFRRSGEAVALIEEDYEGTLRQAVRSFVGAAENAPP